MNKSHEDKKNRSKSKSLAEKEERLLNKINKAKKDLSRLKGKRKNELGDLAIKAGLHSFHDHDLKAGFESLAKELSKQ